MAVQAGEDMLILSSKQNAIYEGFESILKAVEQGRISERRIDQSLERIAHVKSLIRPPLEFNAQRLNELSAEIAELNARLNYSYGG